MPRVRKVKKSNSKNHMVWRIAVYIRLSKDDGNDESLSVTNQKKIIREYLENFFEEEYILVDIYIDDGISGTTDDARTEFIRMIDDVKAGLVNCIICKTLARTFRNYADQGYYLEELFPLYNTRFICLGSPSFDTYKNPESITDGMDVPITGLMNDRYSARTSNDVRRTFNMKRRNGEFIGAFAPYGYKKDPNQKGHLIIDEEAAAVVREVFTLFSQGYGKTAIARMLNDRGIPNPTEYKRLHGLRYQQPKTRNSTLWKYFAISDMLINEIYIGNMVQGRQVKISYKSKKSLHQDRNNWVVVEDTHEPLIDAESFRKVRMLVNSRKRTRSRTYDFLLKGLIFCHECGHPLGVLNRPNAKGVETLYFVCRTYQRFTKNSACTTHYIKEKTVTDAVIAKVREVCEDYLTAEALLPAAEKAVKEASQENKTAAEISALQNKSANLTEHLDRMYTDRLSGLLPEEDFQRIFTRIKDERAQLEERIKELQQQQKNPISQTERAKDLVQRYLDTAYANRELLVSLIERIELTADREIIVKFRFAELQQTG